MSGQNLQVQLSSYPKGWVTLDDFKTVEIPMPEVSGGDVLLRTVYMSADPYMRGRMSDSKDRYVPGFQLGAAITGYIVAEIMESKADGFAAGDWVASPGLPWQNYAALPAAKLGLMKVDPTVVPGSYYLGVLGMPGMTAYTGLLRLGEPKEGETVYVSAASGAVGQLVGQIAKKKGCRVVGSAGSDAKVSYLLDELQFDAAFNYKSVDSLTGALRDACPDGIDVYFENVGGAMLDAVLINMNPFGRIVACGMISQYNLEEPEGVRFLGNVVGKRIRMQGFIVSDFMDMRQQFMEDVSGWLRNGEIIYREDLAQGMENAPSALIGMLEGKNFGKQVIQVGDDSNRPS